MTTLKIDSREPENVQKAVSKEVKKSDQISDVVVEELETADFVCGDIGIERKTGSDFAGSVRNRRLSEQADRMTEEFQHRYVLLERQPFNLKYGDVGDRSLIGQQVSLAAKRDIRQVTTPDVAGTAFAVRRIVERSLSDESVGHVKTVDVETDNVQVAVLAQIRGVSEDKAQLILDKVVDSENGEWVNYLYREHPDWLKDAIMSVDGVGPKLSERVISTFQ